MTLNSILIALLLQTTPAARPPVAKASVAGIAVNAAGEPLAGIRVSLARTDVSVGAIAQMLAGDRPSTEVRLPGEMFATLAEEIAAEVQAGVVVAAETPQVAAEAAAFKSLAQLDIQELNVNPPGAIAIGSKSLPPATTDDRGRLEFNDVEPGTYRLIFSGNGYAKQDFGQRFVGGGGVPMALTAGQAKTDIVMRMMAVATVSGNIRDALGKSV